MDKCDGRIDGRNGNINRRDGKIDGRNYCKIDVMVER